MRPLLKWGVRTIALVVALTLVVAVVGGLWLRGQVRASLPRLDGELSLPGLSAPVAIERDDLGVPTIRAGDRVDVARATGFLHGQDRFFQMDLLRREAAGELAALFGPAVVERDRRHRLHGFRHVARSVLDGAPDDTRAILVAYRDGVNAGLDALGAVPPEYLLLRATPETWALEDPYLVLMAMYFNLQGGTGRRESALGVMHDVLSEPLFRFLTAKGTEWDAPIVGGPLPPPPMPAPEDVGLRSVARSDGVEGASMFMVGSNSWVVAGAHTAGEGALLASDMHLGLSLPNTWYRASFVWPDASGAERRVVGVTLPGTPTMIAGSNGHVAWGFTNSYGDFIDLVVLDPPAGDDEGSYMTPDGPREIGRRIETIRVKGGDDVELEVRTTVWGPVVDRDHHGRRRALRWVAHDSDAANLRLLEMELADGLDAALDIATRTGIPTQNCLVADRNGRIGWTLMGPVPKRIGFDGTIPTSWADGTRRWDGRLPPAEYPRVVDPGSGRIWTANNRVGDASMQQALGYGGYDLGARAGQIRDGLLALEAAAPADLMALQLDDRALFLDRWRQLLLDTLTDEATSADDRRAELRRIVEQGWTGRASVDSAAYRLVRAFRRVLADQVFDALAEPCVSADPRFDYRRMRQWEGSLWRLVVERPAHLLNPRLPSWDAQLLEAVDTMLDRLQPADGSSLDTRTWGDRNTAAIRHPLSLALPQLSRWLDLPATQLPGDEHMPRVQAPRFGASQRMVVSPGREEEGLFHMPGGQSGHPFSPHYGKGHDAWVEGQPTPLLPGPTVHRLTLRPSDGGG